ncbi:PREDICTED: uclacyanin 1-like [Nicotiana attenuata]|uniref:Blue copper protein n=1 Tax=Nicotiana attenuata TaxID=49451 RepID=A0A1J6ID65_NICAT|nr:PREDICTED: uclacyanin 1-like [Nicotiana attenuata]OIT02870.1 blue copper protein [Nicotiana attenuata]
MAMLRVLTSLVVIAMVLGSAMATDYTVGAPNGGWDQTSDLQSWVASQKLFVGDKITFSYAPSHTVLQVTKAQYDSCDNTNPIAIYSGGMTVITLASVGKRYFICGTGGHCSNGMKLEVNILAPPATPPTTPPPSTPTAPPPPTPATPPPSTPTTPPPSTPTTPPPSSPATPPASAPSTTPVASPPSKSSSAPSPKHAPKISPALSPSKSSLAHSPAMPPAGSPTAPTVEDAGLPPSGASAPTPSAPSSADKIRVITGSTVGFGFAVMLMFFL